MSDPGLALGGVVRSCPHWHWQPGARMANRDSSDSSSEPEWDRGTCH